MPLLTSVIIVGDCDQRFEAMVERNCNYTSCVFDTHFRMLGLPLVVQLATWLLAPSLLARPTSRGTVFLEIAFRVGSTSFSLIGDIIDIYHCVS